MNTGNLKSYAPQARREFIAAVTARANLLGLSETKAGLQVAEAEVKNDIVMIAGRPWLVKVNEQRNKLIARMKLQGFGHTVEAVAYAWFNRLAALRYMELHDYLGHGRRVLSNPQGGLPEVLADALDLAESNALPGLPADTVRELKLANQDSELYRLILIAQCNALHRAMPFLFEQLGDETELLLPENLLLTDSVVAKLVQSIPEDDWQKIEIIGWLYQFYISEKKDQVIGKVVKSEDIPAATQLFTPNWIVKYMLQNSLGAQWLATYPDSALKAQMAYYIEPAEQIDKVNAQLAAITPSSLNPEELTLIDPACGSGHILVEAYELFKAIYLERGYRLRDVAKLILEKNLFGLDIDERAAQLTGFALMMKGRADDRQLFERGVRLNVMALVDSAGFDVEQLAQSMKLTDYELNVGDITGLKKLFEHATTFGALIQVPMELAEKLPMLTRLRGKTSQDLFVSDALKRLGPLVRQAEVLAGQYDAVVANPPYIGGQYQTPILKKFLQEHYKGYEKDVFSSFFNRDLAFSKPGGRLGFMSPFVWMFISRYEFLRERFITNETITSLVQLEYSGFEGATVPICTFTLQKGHVEGLRGCFIRLSDFRGADNQGPKTLEAISNRGCGWFFEALQDDFRNIPGSPIAYWASREVHQCFSKNRRLGENVVTREGLTTGSNNIFLRFWWEVSHCDIASTDRRELADHPRDSRWYPFTKGGDFRRWAGNVIHVVDWENDGTRARKFVDPSTGRIRSHNYNGEYAFRPGFTWSAISSALFAVRNVRGGHMFDTKGPMGFSTVGEDTYCVQSLLNSNVVMHLIKMMAPTLDFKLGHVLNMPYVAVPETPLIAERCVAISEVDWNNFERSWDFQSLPLLVSSAVTSTLESSYIAWITQNRDTIAEMKRLEEENNRFFIEAYGLHRELVPSVPTEQISLTVNPAYRYGGKLTKEQLWARFRQDSMAELVSYVIGCMMGRYSLDAPGLIYANRGGMGFDASHYVKFPADADGIVPLTDGLWFEDDAALRVREFLLSVWGSHSLEQNLGFLADSMGRKADESPEQAIRRYLADKFFKDHLQTYKNRPIYWLFSSGKQRAFQALVYLHRYGAGTLSRLRAEYVVPLTGKMQTKIEELEQDVAASTSTGQRNKLSKQLGKLRKQHFELLDYDEKLRHYADERITLDLNEGVRVNYGKFGDLLDEVKAVTGGKGDDE